MLHHQHLCRLLSRLTASVCPLCFTTELLRLTGTPPAANTAEVYPAPSAQATMQVASIGHKQRGRCALCACELKVQQGCAVLCASWRAGWAGEDMSVQVGINR
jgi:hypothetical protein